VNIFELSLNEHIIVNNNPYFFISLQKASSMLKAVTVDEIIAIAPLLEPKA